MPSPAAGPDGLILEPFRGWVFDRRRVDLDDVVCPPYDVVEPDEDDRLQQRSPYNVVRVVRPRGDGARYERAAELLRTWQRDGTLARDPEPALYVYEQRSAGAARRGVIGALELRDPADGVVVPHEDVFEGPVTDRLALLTATAAELEPILLTTDGLDPLEDWLASVATREPDLRAQPADGTEHRVWRISATDDVARVQASLAGRSALIADGHHRYATYRRHQAARRAADPRRGPWDLGLALLVGTAPGALSLGAIHRTVAGVRLPEPSEGPDLSVVALTDVDAASATALQDVLTSAEDDGSVRVVVTDASAAVLVRYRPRSADALARVPAAVMADRVLPNLLGRTDGDPDVDYHHDAGHALAAARSGAGVALLLPPPSLADVRTLADAGVRMPRKSTSFGPKPRSGLVLRTLDE